jgi:carboxyl-terminal processing protease
MRSFKRRTISLRLLFVCIILGIVMIYPLRTMEKAKHDEEVRSMQAKAGHVESDLERREREEKELGRSLWPYVQLLKKKALHPPSKEEMVAHAAKGLCAIDPYSKCFSEDEYEKEQQSLVNSHEGIGIVIAQDEKGARIIDVRIKSPAEKADLRVGDIVTHVIVDRSKVPLAGLSKEEQLSYLRGDEGSTASLVLRRNRRIVVPAPIVRVASIVPVIEKVHLLAPHYGYMHIQHFTHNQAAGELQYAVDLLEQKGVLHGVVIDLRGNGGGSFFESVNMASFFLDGGVVTTTYSRIEGRKSYSAPPGDILHGIPIVLLVDGNSASASELFAGALADRDVPRATLMGEKTFGKGVGQTTEAGPDGGKLVITSFEFFTPKGNGVHGKGLIPDPLLLETFRDEHADDAWQGAALNYLLFMHRSSQAQQ